MIARYLNRYVKIVYNDTDKERNYKAVFGVLTEMDGEFLNIQQDNGVNCSINRNQVVMVKENER